ncbi:MAG: hypothetical protein DDT20_00140 [Firmicutes bacterium]|nr:hypothetical protein [Bacillota bacterium]
MLEDKDILSEVQSRAVFQRGVAYHKQGRVGELHYKETSREFWATVEGEHEYTVVVAFDKDLSIKSYLCECYAYESYPGACKHVVALMKKIQLQGDDLFRAKHATRLPEPVNRLMQDLAKMHTAEHAVAAPVVVQQATLVPTLHKLNSRIVVLTFTIGVDRLYVLKDTRKFVETLVHGGELDFGKNFTYRSASTTFDPTSQALLDMMLGQYYDERYMPASLHSPNAYFMGKQFRLDCSGLNRFLEIRNYAPQRVCA